MKAALSHTKPRLIVEDGQPLAGARKAARVACQTTKKAARFARSMEQARIGAEVTADAVMDAENALKALTAALHEHDPIVVRALIREVGISIRYAHSRASNTIHTIQLAELEGR